MQDQLVCHGCRNTLMYPRGATNVRCALCHIVNMVPLHPHPPPPPPPHHGITISTFYHLQLLFEIYALQY